MIIRNVAEICPRLSPVAIYAICITSAGNCFICSTYGCTEIWERDIRVIAVKWLAILTVLGKWYKTYSWAMASSCIKLTPWSWALLEKPPIVQLLKNSPAFYRTRRFIAVFPRAPPLVPILSQIHPIHTIPFYLSKIHFNIVHPFTSYWDFGLCPSSGILQKENANQLPSVWG
jgi:hypothetical protein